MSELNPSSPHITPVPTDEEAAAIVAAIQMTWPGPAADDARIDPSSRWRFSGRWWNQAPASNRRRPTLR